MPITVEIQLDTNNKPDFKSVPGGLALMLDGPHGLTVRVIGRREDWVALVVRLASWGVITAEIKGVPIAS